MRWGLLILLLLSVSASAEEVRKGTMSLLAVTDNGADMQGTIASLDIEIRPGEGRVFLETFPTTKGDTQISMRFAKQIACNYLDYACENYDFIYTIKSGSGIIGGPSAGAAATLLTIATLNDEEFPTDKAITGTINSGGLVGGVGGIKEKIEAGADKGLKTVLIPVGKRNYTENNQSVDLVAYGGQLGVSVIEVASLDDAIKYTLGNKYVNQATALELDTSYEKIMSLLADDLCERAKELGKNLESIKLTSNDSAFPLVNESNKLFSYSQEALLKEDFYSAASFCFRTNVNRQVIFLTEKNMNQQEVLNKAALIKKGIDQLDEFVKNKEIKTITDLQTFMVVTERLDDASELLDKAVNKSEDPIESAFSLSFANERLYSAKAWSSFFNSEGINYKFEKESLKDSCEQKIREAEERLQYVHFYLPNILESVAEGIQKSYEYLQDEEYELCLFQASKSKSEASMVGGVLGAEKGELGRILDAKLDVTKKAIIRATEKGIFPIVGYSYYEYAKSLSETDKNSALLYAEYAIELSNFDIYFQKEAVEESGGMLNILIGLIIGISLILFLLNRR